MDGFYISIKNDLLDRKHIEAMGSAVWLYMWLLDKMTSINENGMGKVLHGKPITHEQIAQELGFTARTYRRHVETLRAHGYINTLRTPRGLVITVNKAKKVFNQKSEAVKNGTSEDERVATFGTSDRPHLAHPSDKNGTSNILQDSITKQLTNSPNGLVNSGKPSTRTGPPKIDHKQLFYLLVKHLGFSDQVKYTEGRARKLRVGLKNYTPEELTTASKNIGADSFLQGDNPAGKRYGDIDFLLRSDEQIDKWLQIETNDSKDLTEILANAKF